MDKDFKKNFLKGSIATSLGTVSSMVFHFVSIMIMTRSLSKEEFGIYALILIIVHLFNLLSGLGLELTLVKHIAGGKDEEKNSVLFPVLLLRTGQMLLIATLFYFLNYLILPFFGSGMESYAVLITLLFILTSYKDLFGSLLQGLNYFKKFAYVQISSAATRVALIVFVIYTASLGLETLLYIEIITVILAFILQLIFVPLRRLIDFNIRKGKIKEILSFSFPLYLNNLLTFTYDRVHFFVIAAYLTPVSVALFDIANKVPDALKRLFQSFIIVFFPNISTLFSRGDLKGGEKLMRKSLGVFSVIIMFGVIASFLFGEEITVLLFSENYIESSLAFSVLMLVFYFRVVSNIMGYSLVSAGYSSVPVKTNSVSSIVSVGGSILLIPILGFTGVVYALLAMNIVSQFYYHYYLRKAGVNPGIAEYVKPLILGAVIYGIYVIQPIHTIAMRVIFLTLYPIAGYFYLEELRNLANKLNYAKLKERYVNK
jgi:O-antigen/teichoic acid export membrane protein